MSLEYAVNMPCLLLMLTQNSTFLVTLSPQVGPMSLEYAVVEKGLPKAVANRALQVRTWGCVVSILWQPALCQLVLLVEWLSTAGSSSHCTPSTPGAAR